MPVLHRASSRDFFAFIRYGRGVVCDDRTSVRRKRSASIRERVTPSLFRNTVQ